MNDPHPADHRPVRAWREQVTIPSYGVGEPDRNPMFLEKRVYQGSSGAVYPFPVIDRIEDEKRDAVWDAVFLENEYLKIMVLPQLGGRVQMALDKTNGYHFVYYNRVIKPALVGLAGPWISGGIEFNWPQHHRPNTFGPLSCDIAHNADGSATVWCSEIDRMHRTKGMHGLTLYPGKAYLAIHVKLYNRTDLPQTFLWWANPAIHVDEHHQSIFPPDVHAVMDHGKRDVSTFPIATGTYYKVDYAANAAGGTDISRYKNIPVPTSYMAYRSAYNFVGSYDHGRRAGMLHVCNHHVSPGKKQWTWGNDDFGYAWDRHLTDSDGPYIELMCGVYTDNQPDFSWLMPGEEKSFTQVFMPYKGVGVVHNATVDAAVGVEREGDKVTLRVYCTGEHKSARLLLEHRGGTVFEHWFDGSPHCFTEVSTRVPGLHDDAELRVAVLAPDGRELVAYRPTRVDRGDVPAPAKAIDAPGRLDSLESLFLAGLHLEQYRHATREPADYYEEALRRDPGDARCNNAMGRLLMRRGEFALAEPYFRRAVERVTRHNPNPCDGEPSYNLGLTLEFLGRYDEAFGAHYKATWNAAQQEPAYFALARLACRRGDHDEAMDLVERCLGRNTHHHRAAHLRVRLLLALGQHGEARVAMDLALSADRFNAGVLFEQAVMTGDWARFDAAMRGDAESFIELATELMSFGAHAAAAAVLERHLSTSAGSTPPLVHYYLAHLHRQLGDDTSARAHAATAASLPAERCFPNRLETIAVLDAAMSANPRDARAPYCLGNLFYDKRRHDRAIALWERSRELDPAFPTVHRNLGLALFNKRSDAAGAWASFSKAFELDPTDARVFYELDQLARRLRHAPADRLARMQRHRELVEQRDDLFLELVTLLNTLGRHEEALSWLLTWRFHPWEGGEGKVPAQYVLGLTQLARSAMDGGDAKGAVALLERALDWPQSLGEGKLIGIQENNIHYLLGCAHELLGDPAAATRWLERAGVGLSEPTSAVYYNDQPPDMIFYQGLAQRKLGHEQQARLRFENLLAYGAGHMDDQVSIDYFAVSLPDFLVFEEDLTERNRVHCRYIMALGQLGLGRGPEAQRLFDAVLASEPAHQGAIVHRALLSGEERVATNPDVETA